MPAILSKLFILFMIYISCDFDSTKMRLYKLSFGIGCQTCKCKYCISLFFCHWS